MENNDLTQNQILIEIRRISKNIQFFFWLTIFSLCFSLITAIYVSVEFSEAVESSSEESAGRVYEGSTYEGSDDGR